MSAQGTAAHEQKTMEANRKARPSKSRSKSARAYSSRSLELTNEPEDARAKAKLLQTIRREKRLALLKTLALSSLILIISTISIYLLFAD